jgi:hypothetical protein
MLATSQGKEAALKALKERRERAKTEKKIDNARLVAGSDMYFDCIACGCQDIRVSESYRTHPKMCPECAALKEMGWME